MHAFPDPLAIDYEHVCLSTDEPEEPQPNFKPTAVAQVLEQTTPRRARRLTIFDRSFLGVQTGTPSAPQQQYWLRLAFLDPRPSRMVSRTWWVVSGALALLSAVLLMLAWHQGVNPQPGSVIAVAASILATVLSVIIALRRSVDRLVFLTRYGRVPVLELDRRRPDRRSVQRFVAALEQTIRRSAAERPGPRTQRLRDEMREHRRLFEAGVLGQVDFEEAKARILRAHG